MVKEKDKEKVMISLHKPFGPQIMEFVIPENIVNTWNDYGDKITASEKKSKELDMADSLIGNVIQEHKVEEYQLEQVSPSPYGGWNRHCFH